MLEIIDNQRIGEEAETVVLPEAGWSGLAVD